ncbi:MAG: hypothetical protein WCW56_00550 [Candidatus Paceibacterota bacterium]|jgi:hypothetical protein
MSPFEIIFLLCFGVSWPFSIYKSYTSRSDAGKSVIFLWLIFAGYIAGTLHKIFYNFDFVIYLYVLNGLMVLIDIFLYYRNKKYVS